MSNKQKPAGYELIIILGIISYILTIILTYRSIQGNILPFGFDKQWMAISDTDSLSYNSDWAALVVFQLVENIVFIISGLLILTTFFRQSKYFVRSVLLYFAVRVILMTVEFYLLAAIQGPMAPTLTEVISTMLQFLLLPAIWIPFLMLSESIRETFI